MSQEALDHIVQTVDDSDQPLPDNLTVEPYRPVFDATVRTIIYVVCLLASIASVGLIVFDQETMGAFVGTAAGMLASGFGVAYNPNRTDM